MKRQRTTHSDLANLLDDLAARLRSVPMTYLVSDPATLKVLTDAAKALYEQDLRIAEQNVAIRDGGDVRAALLRKRA